MKLVQFEVEIDPFQVVLACATNDDRIPRKLGRTGHKTAKLMPDEITCQFRDRPEED
jgi:hypothetical protein